MKNYQVTIFISCDEEVSADYVKNTFERFIRQEESFDLGGVSVFEESE